jgi:hypothetical protein
MNYNNMTKSEAKWYISHAVKPYFANIYGGGGEKLTTSNLQYIQD